MPPLRVPSWVYAHRFVYNSLEDAPVGDLMRIRLGLLRFRAKDPLVSIVIPAYNEASRILHTLSSISRLKIADIYPTELIVVNDASTDQTQEMLNALGVKTVELKENRRQKGARQIGLTMARGKYLLQADADTLYPEGWGIPYIETLKDPSVSLVYGNHAFIPGPQNSRLVMFFHEFSGEILYRLRKHNREYINVHGFNSAFRREDGIRHGSYDHTPTGSEDGHMALMLSRIGRLHYLGVSDALAWTSDRRIMADGGVWKGYVKRFNRESSRLREYMFAGKRTEP
ncbi:MAG: glycosyltransferase family 2 protein [Bacteroidia bacterium]|nr:glycosyltransferase family 2 protein [Bacteroidia bacterium]